MNIVKGVAKVRFMYHSNACDVVNVLNQLKLISDEKANLKNKKHVAECIDTQRYFGKDISEYEEFIQQARES